MYTYTLLVLLHVVGTILGTGGATIAEIQITRALKDGKLSADERALMHANYGLIRVGMAILLVSVIGMFGYFATTENSMLFTSEKIWIKEIMFVAIFINAIALHKRLVPLWLGASISFTSWWGATLLGMAGALPYSFTTYLVGYVVAIFVVALLFKLIRAGARREYFAGNRLLIVLGVIILLLFLVVWFMITKEQTARTIHTQSTTTAPIAEYRTITHTANFAYPGGSHTIEFVFSIDQDNILQAVQGADIQPDNQGRIADFITEVNTLVAGKPLSELTPLSRVGGASLTTTAFNEAVAEAQAQLNRSS